MNTAKADYEIAREELNSLFASLNLKVDISSPIGRVSDDWPRINYSVAIGSERFDYALGIGHVDWKKASKTRVTFYLSGPDRLSKDEIGPISAVANGKKLVNKQLTADLAAKIARIQKVQPNAAEVLASACNEGQSADQSFENWCLDYGYDSDSRKALAVYEACSENGKKARRLLGAENFNKFAKLSSRL